MGVIVVGALMEVSLVWQVACLYKDVGQYEPEKDFQKGAMQVARPENKKGYRLLEAVVDSGAEDSVGDPA